MCISFTLSKSINSVTVRKDTLVFLDSVIRLLLTLAYVARKYSIHYTSGRECVQLIVTMYKNRVFALL